LIAAMFMASWDILHIEAVMKKWRERHARAAETAAAYPAPRPFRYG
jgi:hypothetical protein